MNRKFPLPKEHRVNLIPNAKPFFYLYLLGPFFGLEDIMGGAGIQYEFRDIFHRKTDDFIVCNLIYR